jgi:hypothetical protein
MRDMGLEMSSKTPLAESDEMMDFVIYFGLYFFPLGFLRV